ncbi:TrkH family potassium uptake protein [Georgenia muralis]|uniref:TrkH family potassium uptake protein n=1 Tax=Georgenia muralis TaxID=154117 RepID=UPI001FE3D6D1|nr:potassium transporter TrkG [Georgenia muralis]
MLNDGPAARPPAGPGRPRTPDGPHTRRPRPPLQPFQRHPAQVLALSFAVALAIGTALLMLPVSVVAEPPTDLMPAPTTAVGGATFVTAVFTASSAVAVTGLVVVDTATYWTPFGQAVILALIQVGGLGIMTFASLLAILMARRLGLRGRLQTSASVRTVGMEDLRGVVLGVARVAGTVQAVVAAILFVRLLTTHDLGPGAAAWNAVFLAGSSFNNAGFALASDNLMGFATDPLVLLPITLAVITGGIGFPVIFELRRHLGDRLRWSMNTNLVLAGTAGLLAVSTVTIAALEWTNPGTLGPLDWPAKLLNAFTAAAWTRTAGFNAVDVSAMHTQTWFAQDIFMFIGGGPAGTAGGIKITTFLVLFFIILTELRGETAVNAFGKRLARSVHREAVTVALLAVAVVMTGTWVLLITTHFTLDQILFEVVSAFGTVGLSTGITPAVPDAGKIMLAAIMFIGRLGPITLGTALATRSRKLLYELPKERPVIG